LAEIETKYEQNNEYNWHFVSYDSSIGGVEFMQSVDEEMRVQYWKTLSSLAEERTAFILRIRVIQDHLLELCFQRNHLI
jgi:hypothetical protein